MPLLSDAGSRLLRCVEPPFGDKVFLARRGLRHWIPSGEHFDSYGFRWDAVELVDAGAMRQYRPAGPVPLPHDSLQWRNPPRKIHPSVLREIATSRLAGSGIEFGAGTNPLPAPLHCRVSYADFKPRAEVIERGYTGSVDDFVDLQYVTSIEDLQGIADRSLDFVIACHVIEHLRNPLRALEAVYRSLAPGGSAVLVVPDKRLTFDKARAVTPLEHLVEDYERPVPERDILHYVEFYAKAFVTPLESLYERVVEGYSRAHDIHCHTWTFETFGETVEYARRAGIFPWHEVWAQPAADHPEANEFYYVLEKSA